MVWTPQGRPARSDAKAPANSTANTPFLRPATDAGYSDPSLAKRSAVGVGQQWVKALAQSRRMIAWTARGAGQGSCPGLLPLSRFSAGPPRVRGRGGNLRRSSDVGLLPGGAQRAAAVT